MDDPERALNLIAETLPISVRHFTALLIRVDRDTQTKK
jgi:transmembrane sensor